MRKILAILLWLTAMSVSAQRITRDFRDVTLSDALKYIQSQTTDYDVIFIYDELEDFRVTTQVKHKSVPDAIMQIVGFYPVRVVKGSDHEIYVECTHKTARRLTGTIIDEEGLPLPYANVAVLSPQDSTLLSGGVSNESGYFAIPYETERVLARISYVGYKTIYRLCNKPEAGTIKMHPDKYTLNGVVVQGERPLVIMKGDAFVTTIEDTYLAKMGTGIDLLCHIPGVLRNGNDIEVIGRGKPLIYINGREMRNKNELDQLSSEQIKEVEVVMTPGAKYDATVKAVIRIKTLHPVGEGFSFDSRTEVGMNHYTYGLEELNLNYRTGGLDLFGMVEYENHRDRYTNDSRQDTYLQSHYEQQSLMHYYNKDKMLVGKIGLNYLFNDSNAIGMTYTVTSYLSHHNNDIWAALLSDGINSEEVTGKGEMDADNVEHIVSGYYAGVLGKWSFDVNADMLLETLYSDNLTQEQSAQDNGRTITTHNNVKNSLYAAKLVASHPLWNGRMEVGTEESYIYRTDLFSNMESIIDESDTKIKETSISVFAQLSQTFGKLTTQIGLRYEHLNSRFYERGVLQDDESRVYNDLFPSAQLTYPLKTVKLRLSYKRNIYRPSYGQLSGKVNYVNRFTYESGNPYLKPSYYDNFSLVANWRWLTVMFDYTRIHDYIITTFSSYKGNPTIVLGRKDNHHGQDNLSSLCFMASAAPTFGLYHPQLMMAMQRHHLKVLYHDEIKQMDNPMMIVRFKNAINLPFIIWGDKKGIWLNADFSWNSAGDGENMHFSPTWHMDLSLFKSFWNDRLSFKLACTDLFSTIRQRVTVYNDMRKYDIDMQRDTRKIELTIRYDFNLAKSKYRGQGAGNDVKGRL